MSTVQISSPSFDSEAGTWTAYANISLADGARCGPHCVELPEEATEEEICAAILALYEPPAAEAAAEPAPAPAPKKAGKK